MDYDLGILMSRTYFKMKHEMCRTLKPFDLTPEQLALLECLWEEERVSQKELSEKTFKDQPTTTRILDRLESKGLVKRMTHPDDRRAFSIVLTDEGRNLRGIVLPLIHRTRQRMLGALEPEEVYQMKVILNKMCNSL